MNNRDHLVGQLNRGNLTLLKKKNWNRNVMVEMSFFLKLTLLEMTIHLKTAIPVKESIELMPDHRCGVVY